jgi:hypothetical protein
MSYPNFLARNIMLSMGHYRITPLRLKFCILALLNLVEELTPQPGQMVFADLPYDAASDFFMRFIFAQIFNTIQSLPHRELMEAKAQDLSTLIQPRVLTARDILLFLLGTIVGYEELTFLESDVPEQDLTTAEEEEVLFITEVNPCDEVRILKDVLYNSDGSIIEIIDFDTHDDLNKTIEFINLDDDDDNDDVMICDI